MWLIWVLNCMISPVFSLSRSQVADFSFVKNFIIVRGRTICRALVIENPCPPSHSHLRVLPLAPPWNLILLGFLILRCHLYRAPIIM